VKEALRGKGQYELLNLDGRGEKGAQHCPRLQRGTDALQQVPGLGEVEDAAIEPLPRLPDLDDVADAKFEDVR
jgi:hypothetical protein